MKMGIFNTVFSSVFLHNSDIWTTTKDTQKIIDTSQRNSMRKILNIRYPIKISNEDLYKIIQQQSW